MQKNNFIIAYMNQQANNSETAAKEIKNRHSWPEGTSGNLSGRLPNLRSADRVLRRRLAERNEAGISTMDQIVGHLIDGALCGDIAASIEVARLVLDSKQKVKNIKYVR